MKFKMPNLSMPDLKWPKASKTKSKIASLLKNNSNIGGEGGALSNIKNKIPNSAKKYIPNVDTDSFDISKVMNDNSFDIDGLLSKGTNMSDITKSFGTDINIDFGSVSKYVPSDVLSQTFDFS